MYVKVNNGTVVQYPYSVGQLQADNPNTSFPEFPSPALLEEWGVFAVAPTPQPFADNTKRIIEDTPVYNNGWQQVWQVIDLDPAEIANQNQRKADEVRSMRNSLLAACDWTQLPDAISDQTVKQYWADYRQSLRDIPDQAGFPWSVIWPGSPEPLSPMPMPFGFRMR